MYAQEPGLGNYACFLVSAMIPEHKHSQSLIMTCYYWPIPFEESVFLTNALSKLKISMLTKLGTNVPQSEMSQNGSLLYIMQQTKNTSESDKKVNISKQKCPYSHLHGPNIVGSFMCSDSFLNRPLYCWHV